MDDWEHITPSEHIKQNQLQQINLCIDTLKEQILLSNQEIIDLKEQIVLLNKEITSLNNRIDTLEQKFSEKNERDVNRALRTYAMGKNDPITFVPAKSKFLKFPISKML